MEAPEGLAEEVADAEKKIANHFFDIDYRIDDYLVELVVH
jgi:hypothetical protein